VAKPRVIECPHLEGPIDFERFLREAPLPQRFLKVGLANYADTPCRAGVATDGENLYAAFAADAPGSNLQAEFWCVGSNDKVWQLIAHSDGEHQLYRDFEPIAAKGVQITIRSGQMFFLTFPLTLAGAPDGELRFNIACHREPSKTLPAELMTYSPLVKSFKETNNFALLRLNVPAVPPRIQVFNLGKGGYSTSNIRNVTLSKALAVHPDVTILLAGTNDMLNTGKLATLEDFENNLRFLVQSLQDGGSVVVMNTLPPCSEALLLRRHKQEKYGDFSPSERITRANAIIRKIAEERHCELVDLHRIVAASGAPDSAASLLRNPANVRSADGVHLRKEGYQLWAEQLAKTDALRSLRPGQKVVCLGDSLTYGANLPGAGTTTGDNMPSYLQKELNH
ncbi:MAG: hypothetical protein IKR81_01865, partial [Victivallales bacterium]|nr:hypothetical protein [Victivallales bacterium]